MTASAEGPAEPTGKGIAGGIMLGAEVVMIPLAIAGVDDGWPYPVFGALGAGAGAVGGYFVEQTGSTEASVYMLAGGMALVIPTIVAVLNATIYDEENVSGDESDSGDGEALSPIVEPSGPGTPAEPAAPTLSRREARREPLVGALVGLSSRGLRPGVPAIDVRPLYDELELARFGVEQGTELRVPVVSATF